MAEKHLIAEEQYRFSVITQVIKKEIKPGQAAKILDLSVRQIRRLKTAITISGKDTIGHGLRGKESNHQIDPQVKEKALTLIREKYSDFKPTFASEKLREDHNLAITGQTIRMWMSEAKLWKPRKQKQTEYRSWRPRKEYYGELEQFDGSYHLWFENRFIDEERNPIEVCLLASIDDATGKITKAVFAANEGIHAVFIFWKEYLEEIGKPANIYLDKFSTYKINHKAAVDNEDLMTQFQRAMSTLAISLIHANSPQAKGRVERLFQTLQDRLVKEMRLATINNPIEGNKFLKEVFLPKWNSGKFVVVATKEGDVHKPLLKEETGNINHIFSIQETRKINNDFTIQFKTKYYQLMEIQPTTVRAREEVIIEVWLDGSIHILKKTHELSYIVLPDKPKRQSKQPIILTTHKLNYKPPQNHPWRQYQDRT